MSNVNNNPNKSAQHHKINKDRNIKKKKAYKSMDKINKLQLLGVNPNSKVFKVYKESLHQLNFSPKNKQLLV